MGGEYTVVGAGATGAEKMRSFVMMPQITSGTGTGTGTGTDGHGREHGREHGHGHGRGAGSSL
jgi:hypothetical protein